MTRKIDSGWCQTGYHHKCRHHLQEARDVLRRNGSILKIVDVWCACLCHKESK